MKSWGTGTAAHSPEYTNRQSTPAMYQSETEIFHWKSHRSGDRNNKYTRTIDDGLEEGLENYHWDNSGLKMELEGREGGIGRFLRLEFRSLRFASCQHGDMRCKPVTSPACLGEIFCTSREIVCPLTGVFRGKESHPGPGLQWPLHVITHSLGSCITGVLAVNDPDCPSIQRPMSSLRISRAILA